MIRKIEHLVSDALARENAIHAAHVKLPGPSGVRLLYRRPEDFCAGYLESAEGRQFLRATADLKPGARVFDIGAGQGHIAVCLAVAGMRATAVEPCERLCQWIDDFATAFDLSIQVVCSTGEGLIHHEPDVADLCIFSASLHHCDDPLACLLAVNQLLSAGGRLLLLNEPHLQRFRSKAWFERMLADGQCPAGDYGGNEHTYYWHEYRRMIRQAGFIDARDWLAERYRSPESYEEMMRNAGASPFAHRTRRWYYRVVRGMEKLGPIGSPALAVMKRLSLLQVNYSARKIA